MAFREYFSDFRTEVIGLLDFGDVVVSRVVFRGTCAGGWMGVHSAGATTEVSRVDVF
jgi:predicted ester cyclase